MQRLKDVEADRLKDEAVRTALVAEQARRKREADRKRLLNAPAPTVPAPEASNGRPGATAVDDNGSDSGDDAAPTGAATRPSLPNAGGGQTGGGGNGSFPAVAATTTARPGWVCPTGSAPAPFADTWGAPRSGGRRHQGVDMIGQRGIPVLAVVDGVAEPRTNVLGGTTIWFSGVDGHKYYYAHLDGYPQLGSVTAGTPIGFLGQTGNAQFSIPHLHFEVHPFGGPAVNPYPTVAAHCPSFAG